MKLYNLRDDPSWKIGLDNTILRFSCDNKEFYVHYDPGGHDVILPINIYKLKEVIDYIINNEVLDESNIK